MLKMVSAGGSKATSKQESTPQPLGRQDTGFEDLGNSQETWPGRHLSHVWDGRQRQGWLSSISAVYVGNVRTEMLGQAIRKPWGHWRGALGLQLTKLAVGLGPCG